MSDICSNCKAHLPQKGHYCPSCATQIKCKSCNEILEPNAKACIYCGVLKAENNISSQGSKSAVSTSAAPQNSIEYRETKHTKSFKALYSNEVGAGFSDVVSQVLLKNISKHSSKINIGEDVDQPEIDFSPSEVVDDKIKKPLEISESANSLRGTEAYLTSDISKVFKFEEDKAILDDVRLKAHTRYNYVERLVILFLYAHKLNSKSKVSREEVNDILKETGLYDSNARKWISESDRYVRKISETNEMELIIPGVEKAKEYLAEATDPSIENKWNISTQTKTRKKIK